MKKDEILSFTSKWMELENIILSEVSHAQKTKILYILPHMWTLDLGQMQQLFDLGHTLQGEHKREV
jgi:lauroyl/myristoyl acyltransferase